MEMPRYEPHIEKQNDVYTEYVLGWYIDKPKSGLHVLSAVYNAFNMGAGGLKGSMDAVMTLENGGLELLLEKLELTSISPEEELSEDRFAEVVRAAIAHGAQWDLLDDEIHHQQ